MSLEGLNRPRLRTTGLFLSPKSAHLLSLISTFATLSGLPDGHYVCSLAALHFIIPTAATLIFSKSDPITLCFQCFNGSHCSSDKALNLPQDPQTPEPRGAHVAPAPSFLTLFVSATLVFEFQILLELGILLHPGSPLPRLLPEGSGEWSIGCSFSSIMLIPHTCAPYLPRSPFRLI